jgi:dihydroorotate dehydrogenase electron transfer subunit
MKGSGKKSRARILYNKEIAEGYFRLGLDWRAPRVAAGQFVMVKITEGQDPLLRRPFGIYGILNGFRGGIEILYKVVGRGTLLLAGKYAGESVDVLGPLGNGFGEVNPKGDVIIVAGGMGAASLYLLAKRLNRGVFLFGGRTKKDSVLAGDFKKLKCAVKISTEDGTVGVKGVVTDLLKDAVTPASAVYACGPSAMLKVAAKISGGAGAKCLVSLEKAMACGIGVCLGCAVKGRRKETDESNKTYKMVCSEGPVFNSNDIDWEAF